MNSAPDFCTCGDLNCPNHPVNHGSGCTLCIEKNLKAGEIPSCFFKKADPDYHGPGYRAEDYARLILKGEKKHDPSDRRQQSCREDISGAKTA